MIIDPENFDIELSEDDLELLSASGYLDAPTEFGIDLVIRVEELAASIDDLVLGETILYGDWALRCPAPRE